MRKTIINLFKIIGRKLKMIAAKKNKSTKRNPHKSLSCIEVWYKDNEDDKNLVTSTIYGKRFVARISKPLE